MGIGSWCLYYQDGSNIRIFDSTRTEPFVIPVTLTFLVIVSAVVLTLAVVGQLAVRRFVKANHLKMHHDVADPLLSVVGTMFAVLLGFMVANAMSRFEEARVTVQQEASAVADIWRAADGLEPKGREKIKHLCADYVDMVLNDEWSAMAEKRSDAKAWTAYNDLWHECACYLPQNQGDSNVHQSLLENIAQVGNCRRLRIEALHNGLPPVLWGVLLLGGAATIVFTYFFGIENTRLQSLMTALVSLVICLNVFLLAAYDDPFSGDVQVTPLPFQIDRDIFKNGRAPGFSEQAH